MLKQDRTYLAMRKQLVSMCCSGYEIGLRNRESGKMLPRRWIETEILKSVDWLKHQNLNGHDIYIRPAPIKVDEQWFNPGLILVDDLTIGQLDRMDSNGHNPAAIIETSPLNFQAWVRVSHQPISSVLATQIGKWLAQRYQGDMNSADWRHYGRLAGFTNQKPQYAANRGKHPYVLAGRCNGKIAVEAEKMLLEASLISEGINHHQDPSSSSQEDLNANQEHIHSRGNPALDPAAYFQRLLSSFVLEFGSDFDESRGDWMIVKSMLVNDFSDEQIRIALTQCSPNLHQRKQGHVQDYIERTIRNAKLDPKVANYLQQHKLI